MTYVSLAEVKAYVGDWNNADQDDLVEDVIIPNVCALIDQFTHRTFEAAADTTHYLDAVADVGYGDGSSQFPSGGNWIEHGNILRTLWLSDDLCAITSITNGDGVAVASTEYVTLPLGNSTPFHGIRLKSSSTVAWTYDDDSENAIAIVGKWAYSTTAPAVVKQAALRWVKWLYQQRDSNQTGIEQPQMSGDGVWIFPQAMPKDVALMLTPLVKRV